MIDELPKDLPALPEGVTFDGYQDYPDTGRYWAFTDSMSGSFIISEGSTAGWIAERVRALRASFSTEASR